MSKNTGNVREKPYGRQKKKKEETCSVPSDFSVTR